MVQCQNQNSADRRGYVCPSQTASSSVSALITPASGWTSLHIFGDWWASGPTVRAPSVVHQFILQKLSVMVVFHRVFITLPLVIKTYPSFTWWFRALRSPSLWRCWGPDSRSSVQHGFPAGEVASLSTADRPDSEVNPPPQVACQRLISQRRNDSFTLTVFPRACAGRQGPSSQAGVKVHIVLSPNGTPH